METKTTVALSSTETRTSITGAIRQWLNQECRWATRLTRELTDSTATATNATVLAEANLFTAITTAAVLADNLSTLGIAAVALWVLASYSLMKKGGKR